MGVGCRAVVLFSGLLQRVHVDHGHVEVAQLMQEPMVDLSGYGVSFCYREIWRDRNVNLGT